MIVLHIDNIDSIGRWLDCISVPHLMHVAKAEAIIQMAAVVLSDAIYGHRGN